MPPRLYVAPGSAPSMAARLMLDHKGIPYRRRDLIHPSHRLILRLLRFPGVTVPALRLEDGRRIQGSREIARRLDQLQPEPRLFPTDPSRRAAVEEAERWGDEVLQAPVRRIAFWGIRQDRASVRSFLEGARIGIPTGIAARTSAPVTWLSAKLTGSDDEAVEADVRALPEMIDHVDGLIDAGTLGSDPPTAADFQIAPSVALLLCFSQLRDRIGSRQAAGLARRVAPDYPGEVGEVLPESWLERLA